MSLNQPQFNISKSNKHNYRMMSRIHLFLQRPIKSNKRICSIRSTRTKMVVSLKMNGTPSRMMTWWMIRFKQHLQSKAQRKNRQISRWITINKIKIPIKMSRLSYPKRSTKRRSHTSNISSPDVPSWKEHSHRPLRSPRQLSRYQRMPMSLMMWRKFSKNLLMPINLWLRF